MARTFEALPPVRRLTNFISFGDRAVDPARHAMARRSIVVLARWAQRSVKYGWRARLRSLSGGRLLLTGLSRTLPSPRDGKCRLAGGTGVGRGGRLNRADIAVNSVQSQLEAVGDTKLVKDVVEVVLDGLFADEHLFGDLFVLEALSDTGHDLAFSIA